MILVYETTDLVGLHPIFIPALRDLDRFWQEQTGYELHVLHGLDGIHSDYSRHYQGCAVDIGTWKNPKDPSSGQIEGYERSSLFRKVQELLGENFWILDHETHFHISFKPKKVAWTKTYI